MKRWRELIADAPKRPPEEISPENAPAKTQKPVKCRFPSSGGPGQKPGQKSDDRPKAPDTAPRSRLVRTGPTTWVEADWAKALCVFCDEPTAPGDIIACPEHRARIVATVMPWERKD